MDKIFEHFIKKIYERTTCTLSFWSLKKVSCLFKKRGKAAKDYHTHFREDTKAHEKMLNIIVHHRNAIKTSKRYYYTSITMDGDKKLTTQLLAEVWRK